MTEILCSDYTVTKGSVFKMIASLCFGFAVFKGSVLIKKSYTMDVRMILVEWDAGSWNRVEILLKTETVDMVIIDIGGLWDPMAH